MKYNKTASILGKGARIIGRMPKDSIKRVRVNRAGIAVDYRKGGMVAWYIRAPFRLMRVLVA